MLKKRRLLWSGVSERVRVRRKYGRGRARWRRKNRRTEKRVEKRNEERREGGSYLDVLDRIYILGNDEGTHIIAFRNRSSII